MNPGASPGETLQGVMNIRAESLPAIALYSGALLDLGPGENPIPKQFTTDARATQSYVCMCVHTCMFVHLYTYTSHC